MNVNELLAERTPREKLLLAVLLVASVVVGGYYLLDSPAHKSVPAKAPTPVAARTAVPVMIAVNRQAGRDPFLPPPELANFDRPNISSVNISHAGSSPSADHPQSTTGIATTADRGRDMTLKGVVSSKGNYMAIISVGNSSKVYGVGENAGGYVLESISAKSATLSGPGGRLVLTLGK